MSITEMNTYIEYELYHTLGNWKQKTWESATTDEVAITGIISKLRLEII